MATEKCRHCGGTGGTWHCDEYHAHSTDRCMVHTCPNCTGRDEYIAPGSPKEQYPKGAKHGPD